MLSVAIPFALYAAVCLLVRALAPVVTVVGYETLGYRHIAEAPERL